MTSVRDATSGDAGALATLDTSFVARTAYRAIVEPRGFRLEEHDVPERTKRYEPPQPGDAEVVLVAESESGVVGVTALNLEAWNRRGRVEHLYVAPAARGAGTGRALVEALAARASGLGVRCLWAETQNVNPAAIAFYPRVGFRLCGLDLSLYDPAGLPGEFAVYFSRDLG
jgi:GNAT superfamily N-acetyltransferase